MADRDYFIRMKAGIPEFSFIYFAVRQLIIFRVTEKDQVMDRNNGRDP
jgi:hypothetical protein